MRFQTHFARALNLHSQQRWSDWTLSATGSHWDSRAGKYLRHGVEFGLGVLILVLLASFWWPHARLSEPDSVLHAVAPSTTPPADMANAIVAAHLFGRAQANAPAAAPAAVPVTVEGIVYATDPGNSETVLTIAGKTNVYRVGDALPDGEKLAAIDASGIELGANGSVRRMEMAHYGSADSQGPAAYAALLHGTGLSAPTGNNPQTGPLTQVNGAGQTFLPNPARTLYPQPVSAIHTVHLSPRATPLEQLRSLRAQLIRQ